MLYDSRLASVISHHSPPAVDNLDRGPALPLRRGSATPGDGLEEFEPCGSDVFAHEESLVVASWDSGVEFQAVTERVPVTHDKYHLLDQWMGRVN